MTQKVGGARGATGREMDDATVQRFLRDIHASISRHNARLERGRRASKTTVDRRTTLVLSVFRDLWRLGYSVGKVENLRREHCVSALRAWIARGIARATAAQKWVALEGFAQALGKQGMVPEFATLWPVEGGTKMAGRRRVTVVSLGQEQYTHLLEKFGPGEEVYWALRLERQAELTTP